jgi:hypothetical protein
VYEYICSVYKKNILTGQQESIWMSTPDYELDYIFEVTGRLSAIRGMDFHYDDFDGVVERAKDWWERGGIPTICWHCGSDFSGNWWDSLQTELDWDNALTPGTPEYDALIAGWTKPPPRCNSCKRRMCRCCGGRSMSLTGTGFGGVAAVRVILSSYGGLCIHAIPTIGV